MTASLQSRWLLPEIDRAAADALAGTLGIGPLAARVLLARGFSDPDAARRFLHPGLADLHDPMLLAGMAAAVERLLRAIRTSEQILIYGDYDVDGATSVVILKKAIELAGGRAIFHIPHRLRDGYGMRPEVVEAAAAEGVSLIVSVDTGIRAAETVRRARELSIDVIITDHHLPESELPPALAIINPNQPGCPYPEKNLCGVGVAFKLVQALLGELSWPHDKVRRTLQSFLKLVAIGTVADVVPLTGENRIIVRHGLEGLDVVKNPGLRAILDVAGIAPGEAPSAGQVAFRIAPRINAAGRMNTANDVIELFLTASPERAREIAERLNTLNSERQMAEQDIVRAILKECEMTPVTPADFALVFAGDNWHRGVLGIVASRLVERFRRPAFVLSHSSEDGLASGSGRSIPAFHLLDALESMAHYFRKFGGHAHAAGLTMDSTQVDLFRGDLNRFAAARLTPEDLAPALSIDAEISLAEVNEQSAAEVLELAPFGHGNPTPLFACRAVEIAGPAFVMKEKHLRIPVRQNGRTIQVKAWNFAERAAELPPGRTIDIAFTIEDDAYSRSRGYAGWSATLRDFR